MITEKEFDDYRILEKEYIKVINAKTLKNCNMIIQIGTYTAKLDENGKVILSRTKFPLQFTKETALKMLNMNWISRSDRKPFTEMLTINEWYQNRIKALESILSLSK